MDSTTRRRAAKPRATVTRSRPLQAIIARSRSRRGWCFGMASDRHAALIVFGATGMVGQRICHELAAAGIPFEIAGRRESALTELASRVPIAHTHVADTSD